MFVQCLKDQLDSLWDEGTGSLYHIIITTCVWGCFFFFKTNKISHKSNDIVNKTASMAHNQEEGSVLGRGHSLKIKGFTCCVLSSFQFTHTRARMKINSD